MDFVIDLLEPVRGFSVVSVKKARKVKKVKVFPLCISLSKESDPQKWL
jgi:hypothetical protein